MRSTWNLLLAVALLPACDSRAQTQTPPPSKSAPAKAPEPAPTEQPTEQPTEATSETPEEAAGAYREAGGVQYVELVTGGAKAENALPLIIAIHGLGDRPEDFSGLLRDFPEPARVILPRALDDHEVGFSWFPIRARSEDVEGLSAGIKRAADALAKHIKAIRAARPTVGRPIVTGFSQGGMLSFTLAAHHPDQVAAAYPVGGWLPPPLWPKTGPSSEGANPPVVALHGDDDRALLIENTRESVARQRELGYDVELVEYPGIGHQITLEMRTKLWGMLKAAAAREREAGASAKPTKPAG